MRVQIHKPHTKVAFDGESKLHYNLAHNNTLLSFLNVISCAKIVTRRGN